MSVQLEDGFTQIANELLENLPKYKFNGTQLRIIMVVWRFTYGFKRKDHEMSLSFFTKATGLGKTQIDRELTNLIDYKVLIVTEESTYTKSRKLGFNKIYSDWSIEYSQQISVESAKTLTVSENAEEQSANMRTHTVSKNADQERKVFKENLKENTTDDFDKVRIAFNDIHKVLDMPMQDSPTLSKLLDDGVPSELIIDVMKEKNKNGVKTIKYYVEAIKERHEGKERTPFTTRKRNEPDWDKILKQMEGVMDGSKQGA